MNDDNNNFDQLRKLLSLKQHELPPPGYFNKLPGEIVSRIRSARWENNSPMAKLRAEAPWLMRFWEKLDSRPAFAGAFGVAASALLLGGVFFAQKPDAPPAIAESTTLRSTVPFAAAGSVDFAGKPGLIDPVMVPTTNTNGIPAVNLFDLVQPGQVLPASAPAPQ